MRKIDLQVLKIMLVSGANNLYNHHNEVNKLNVFPVPDGDTGTNMNLTMMNGIKELGTHQYQGFKDFADDFTHGLVMGARGNSGVILSQIFRGFFESINGNTTNENNKIKEITSNQLLKAWMKAKDFAYKAVMKPVEGTILTVISDGSNQLNAECAAEKDSVVVFEKLLEFMQASLKRTPELLPILKKTGNVDSGGAGLVYIVEGMLEGLKNKKVLPVAKKLSFDNKVNLTLSEIKEFGYCTVIVVKLNKISKLEFSLSQANLDLAAMDGQSITAVEDKEIVKIHVHSLKPGEILNYMQQFGELISVKIENMTEQAKTHVKEFELPRKLVNNYAIIACVNGKGIETYLKDELKVDFPILYSTRVNPSTEDFLNAIELVDAKVVYILPNDNNLVLTAKQASKLEKKSKIHVIETVNIAQGMAAALAYNNILNSADKKTVLKTSFANKLKYGMEDQIKKVSYGYLTVADRDSEIDSVKVKKNHYISGALLRKEEKTQMIASNKELITNVTKLFADLIWNSAEVITIFKGKTATLEEIYQITKILDEQYNIEYEFIEGGQSVYHFMFVVE